MQLDYLVGVTSANFMQEVSGKADCIIYKSFINENAILFHLILCYHQELFIELYEQFSKGREVFEASDSLAQKMQCVSFAQKYRH